MSTHKPIVIIFLFSAKKLTQLSLYDHSFMANLKNTLKL